jgi:hypothetical protein
MLNATAVAAVLFQCTLAAMRLATAVVLAAVSGACGRGGDSAEEPSGPPPAPDRITTSVTEKMPVTDAAVPTCLMKIEADHSRSVLQEQRSRGPHANDFFASYPAAAIDPAKQEPIRATDAFRVGGNPVLWLSADKASVVVDQRAFSTLTNVDGTRHTGDPIVVGKATAATLKAMPPRDLARFLIAAGVVRIYVHIGGWVCLEEETSTNGGWRGRFAGSHQYFTNEENNDPLAFVIEMVDGTITFSAGAGTRRR